MPAVQLAQLRIQIYEMIGGFSKPEDFIENLKQIFEFYGDRVYKPGKVLQPAKLVPAYHAPAIVLQQLEQQLSSTIQENPDAALILADMLWKDKYLEPRLLAIAVLSQIPLDNLEPVMHRFFAWCQPEEETKILNLVLTKSSTRMRREKPEQWLEMISVWINNPNHRIQAIGLKAILPLINEREFENLPAVFLMITSLISDTPAQLHVEIGNVIDRLYKRSPNETIHFLHHVIQDGISQDSLRMIRRVIPRFSIPVQEGLRDILEKAPA